MATFGNLLVKIGLDAKALTSGLGRVDSQLKKSQRAFNKFGSGFRNLGKQLSVGLTLPIAGLGVAVAKFAGDFESSMQKVQALSGSTGKEFDALREQAKKLGIETKFSASQAAEGMGFLAQASFKTNQILAAMPGVLSLAAAGNLELAEAAKVTAGVLAGFGLEASQAAHVADVLAVAATSSQTNVSDMAAALAEVAPIAKLVGLSLEDTAALVSKLSDSQIGAEKAGTALRGMLGRLIDATPKAARAMEDLGVAIFDAAGEMRPVKQIMQDLADIAGEHGSATKQATKLQNLRGTSSGNGGNSSRRRQGLH